ncbi:MAG: amino acid permease [Pseudomonadota bacterium]
MAELTKTLNVWRGTAMMLNIVLGAGLLTLPGLAVAAAGGAALTVWAACALASIPLLIVFGLLGKRLPNAGGLAHTLNSAFGPKAYGAATFLFLGAVVLGLPAIALTGGFYAAATLGGSPYLYAVLLVGLAAISNLASAKVTGRINEVIASLLIFVIAGIAAVGLYGSGTAESAPALPVEMPTLTVFSATFMMIFFAFTGWEVSANLSGEFRDAKRAFPLAMALSFLLAVLLYGALAITVQMNPPTSGFEAPFVALFAQQFGPVGGIVISVVSVILIFANLSAAIWAVSRMVYSAASEGLISPRLAQLHNGTPITAVLVTLAVLLCVIVSAASGSFDLGTLLAAAGLNFLLLYAGSAAALLRVTDTGWHRAIAILSIFMVIGLMAARGANNLIYPAALIALGAALAQFRAMRAQVQSEAS